MRFRIIVALLTPFREDGEVDHEALRAHVEWLAGEGVDALMPCGTTGEGALLEPDEVLRVVETTLAGAAGRAEVLAHVGRPSTRASVALVHGARELGVAGLSAVLPYYYAVGEEGLRRHYGALLEAAGDVPLYAYTIPDRTVNELPPAVFDALAADGLAGVKDSTKSWDLHLEYLEVARRHGREALMGSDGMVLQAKRHGAAGVVSALANVRPSLFGRLAEADGEEADALMAEVSALRTEMAAGGSSMPGVKRAVSSALAERGVVYPAALRAPLTAS